MAILAFQKPDKVLMLEADDFFGKFEFRPLEPGYVLLLVMPCAVFSCLHWKGLLLRLSKSTGWIMNLTPSPALLKM